MASYGRLCTLFYDTDAPSPSDAEVAWYCARLPPGSGPSLEAMSGSGRLLIPLLQQGRNVHGVDPSPSMIESCEARLSAAGLTTPLFRQDIAALNLPFRYVAAIFAGGSFQRLADPLSAHKALERIRAHLVDPGLLLMEMHIPAAAAHPPGAPMVQVQTIALPNGAKIARRSEVYVDVDARRIDIKSRYEQRERATITAREDETLAITWYSEDEIVALLRDAGYRDVTIGEAASSAQDRTAEEEQRYSVSARI